MNNRIRNLVAVTTVLFSLCLPALAQSSDSSCKNVRGNLAVTFTPGAANGVVTRAGNLNGPFVTAFLPGSVAPTADPTSITFVGTSTLTAVGGTLVTHDVYLFDFVLSVGPGMLRIDPNASTGIFANATGVVYLNALTGGNTSGEADLGGWICYANE